MLWQRFSFQQRLAGVQEGVPVARQHSRRAQLSRGRRVLQLAGQCLEGFKPGVLNVCKSLSTSDITGFHHPYKTNRVPGMA